MEVLRSKQMITVSKLNVRWNVPTNSFSVRIAIQTWV